MAEYKVVFSYLNSNGERVSENDFTSLPHTASDAANEVREYYSDLPGFRIDRVYCDTGTAWEEREFDY